MPLPILTVIAAKLVGKSSRCARRRDRQCVPVSFEHPPRIPYTSPPKDLWQNATAGSVQCKRHLGDAYETAWKDNNSSQLLTTASAQDTGQTGTSDEEIDSKGTGEGGPSECDS